MWIDTIAVGCSTFSLALISQAYLSVNNQNSAQAVYAIVSMPLTLTTTINTIKAFTIIEVA